MFEMLFSLSTCVLGDVVLFLLLIFFFHHSLTPLHRSSGAILTGRTLQITKTVFLNFVSTVQYEDEKKILPSFSA